MPVFDVALFSGGSVLGHHMFQLVAMMIGIGIAVFRTTIGTLGLCLAGCFAAGAVLCFHGVAGAVAAVGAVAIRCPRTPIVGMFVAGLGLERRQGLTRRAQILTLAVPWVFAVAAVIDE